MFPDALFPARHIAVRSRVAGLLFAAGMAAGCTVGPDFLRPAAPDASGYTPEPLAAQTAQSGAEAGERQSFLSDRDIQAGWWQLYHCQPLDALMALALKSSPTLEAARATLREARENLYAQEGSFFPSLSSTVSATREKSSGAGFGSPGLSSLYSVSSASLSVSYTLDVFGGVRREVEASAAQADYERFELAASYLTLTANIVTAAVNEASLRAQIDATQQIVDIESHQLDVLQNQLALGGVAGSAVLAQQATLAQARASLPPLQKQLAQARNQLAVLAGRPPSDDIGTNFTLSALTLPTELPLSLPSRLVEQRPDIRAAEEQLHEASAEIGVATANMLPQITLTGSLGSTASPPGGLFTPGTGVWSLAGSLAQPIFEGGTLLHKKRAAVAAFDAASAQYRGTVLSAFQDVANAIRALQSDADALAADMAAEQAAGRSLALSQDQFKLGATTYTALLDAEQTYQQTRLTRVQAEAARFSDTAALFQALGGGWWNEAPAMLGDEPPPRWAILAGQ
jgi:NodT family efflux transporter outer membrane factor (OMF) lipoprotein